MVNLPNCESLYIMIYTDILIYTSRYWGICWHWCSGERSPHSTKPSDPKEAKPPKLWGWLRMSKMHPEHPNETTPRVLQASFTKQDPSVTDWNSRDPNFLGGKYHAFLACSVHCWTEVFLLSNKHFEGMGTHEKTGDRKDPPKDESFEWFWKINRDFQRTCVIQVLDIIHDPGFGWNLWSCKLFKTHSPPQVLFFYTSTSSISGKPGYPGRPQARALKFPSPDDPFLAIESEASSQHLRCHWRIATVSFSQPLALLKRYLLGVPLTSSAIISGLRKARVVSNGTKIAIWKAQSHKKLSKPESSVFFQQFDYSLNTVSSLQQVGLNHGWFVY